MSEPHLTRDEIASRYLDQLPYAPYPVQEEALLAWFSDVPGVMVCAPTGMGKTLIAEAAMFEALHTGRVAYYTTPLIALTEQKFREMQEAAVRWGFREDDVGLVTGNRSVNPGATVRVVVAEILLNRLLHPESFDFAEVSSVVMDEFHSFADPERGIVWELSLGLLPEHVRLLLLSATVGNTAEFMIWLARSHGRRLQLVQSTDRKVPLTHNWIGDQLLDEHLEWMAQGEEADRKTPALVFCFNRDQCWSVAEQLRGKGLLAAGQQKKLAEELEKHDWSTGAGPKLKAILLRGVGVHHAGIMPRYRRLVEHLFQRKLLTVCVCTETLAAGINLPARSVVLTTLLKGPPGEKKLVDASSAHQMFGRAGRPQFDAQGYVYALAHEDDVKIARFKEKLDQIPADTKDPNLIKARKRMEKKAPTRRKTEQYWNADQFEKLRTSPPGKLYSKGPLPWRLLAYMLKLSPEVGRIRTVVRKRLMDDQRLEAGERALTRMLVSLWAGGYVTLEPEPPQDEVSVSLPPLARGGRGGLGAPQDPEAGERRPPGVNEPPNAGGSSSDPPSPPLAKGGSPVMGSFGALLQQARSAGVEKKSEPKGAGKKAAEPEKVHYAPTLARPTPKLDTLLVFRAVNPLYGAFLVEHLGVADRAERIQALESVLEVPGSLARDVRVPRFEDLPPGPLAKTRLDQELVARGLVAPQDLLPKENAHELPWEERWVPTLAEKLRLLFDSEFPGVADVHTRPVWIAGELVAHGGDFNKYVTAKALTKQEGLIFRHLLRLILLCNEFAQVAPPDASAEEWRADLLSLADTLTESCRKVDPDSTDQIIEAAKKAADIVRGEAPASSEPPPEPEAEFGEGLW